MESFIHDLDEEVAKCQATSTSNDKSKTEMTTKSNLSGDTTNDNPCKHETQNQCAETRFDHKAH